VLRSTPDLIEKEKSQDRNPGRKSVARQQNEALQSSSVEKIREGGVKNDQSNRKKQSLQLRILRTVIRYQRERKTMQ